jgi:hypothetical protein
MAADVVNTVAAQLESVRPILQEIYENSDQISRLFKKNDKNIETVTRYLYRIPLMQYMGGTHRKYSANGGSLGTGSGMKLTSLQAGYFYTLTAFRVTDEQVDLSKNTKQSVVNVMSKTLSGGMMEAAVSDDQWLHTDGTGELTLPCSSITGTNSMTFNATGDTLGIDRLREGMAVGVWTYDGATERAAATLAPIKIETIDYSTKTVVFDQNVTSLSAGDGVTTGDLITFCGMAAYGPSTLTSFSAGWPATGALTTTGGLTNDSGRHGIYYAHNFNTSNYYLGKQKSAIPQLSPIQIAAGGAELSWQHGFALQDQIRKRRNADVAEGLIGIFPLAQRAVVFDHGVSIATKPIMGEEFGKSIDVLPTNNKYADTFNYADMVSYVDKRQYKDRVDFCNLKNWGRAQVFPLQPYTKDGNTVFPGHDSSGSVAAYSEFFFNSAYDFVNFDPGAEGAITGLAVPPIYA